MVSMLMNEAKFSDLKGKTFTEVTVVNTEDEVIGNEITFTCTDGNKYILGHQQDCCKHVYIESIVGDLSDLIGNPILTAEESISDTVPPPGVDSTTWTFYKLATIKGYVDIRWCGSSNGFYSESVGLYIDNKPESCSV